MSRIDDTFARLRAEGRQALIPFVTAGDPLPERTVPLLHDMVAAGADVIELGVPFSDPMADGPVIQAADERALAHGVSLCSVLDMVRRFREGDERTPLVLMGYLNPIEVMGYGAFAEAAAGAGVDGVLVVDLPPEEAHEFSALMKQHGIAVIFLIAPTTDAERIAAIDACASGYLYYVSLKGVTGANTLDVDEVARRVEAIRAISSLPVGVGFGIKDGATAQAVARVADAVVVGSALVRQIEQHADDAASMNRAVTAILRDMRGMMDA